MNLKPTADVALLPIAKKADRWVRIIMFMVAVVTMGAIVVDYGFVLYPKEQALIEDIYLFAWWMFGVSYVWNLIYQWGVIKGKKIIFTVIWGLLWAAIGVNNFVTIPGSSYWLTHRIPQVIVMFLFSVLEVSRGITNIINKRTNPAILMAAGFAFVIGFGAFMLLLPRSTQDGIVLPVVDAIFVSTSAVCVTGLTPVEIAEVFTTEGQIIIAMLIQIGGLGVMTITSFFALFFMGGSGLYNQFALRDLVGSETMSSLLSTLLSILAFTFIIEGIGALCIWFSIHGTLGMNLQEELFFSIFHAVSAFCNAGFSTLYRNLGNEAIMYGHNAFFLIISSLIVLGGLGFPILMNFKSILFYRLKTWGRSLLRKPKQPAFIHLTQLNTKIVLTTTLILIVLGSVGLALLEWNGAFAGLPVADKITQSIFNAIAPRTAGFISIDLTTFSLLSIMLYMGLMWVGGAAQSTAGGIKVNTLAVAWAGLVSVIKGKDRVVLFKRELSEDSIRRAAAVVFGSLLCVTGFFVALVALEPNLPARGLLFETISAFATVGSSLNISPQLGDYSKLLVSLLMFTGRVGFITLLMCFIKAEKTPHYRLPKDSVIIN